MKLCNLVDVIENNEHCVVLRPKMNTRYALMSIEGFDGTETLMRITKGKIKKVTIYTKAYVTTWETGGDYTTFPSKKARLQGEAVKDCVELDLGIYLGDNPAKISETLHIRKLGDNAGKRHHIEIAYMPGTNTHVAVKKDNEFLRNFPSFEKAMLFVQQQFVVVQSKRVISASGYSVQDIYCVTFAQ